MQALFALDVSMDGWMKVVALAKEFVRRGGVGEGDSLPFCSLMHRKMKKEKGVCRL